MKKLLNIKSRFSSIKGFTLIELLIVIAVLGILAAVVLVAIDPVEQLSRGRDAGRKTTIGQLGRGLQAYYTSQSRFPTTGEMTNVNATNALVVTGEIKNIPPGIQPSQGAVTCTLGSLIGAGVAPTFCYKVDAATAQVIIYTKVESKSELNKGACAGAWASVWFVYSSFDGRAGTVNKASEPLTSDAPFTMC